jgi:hypothetical protein
MSLYEKRKLPDRLSMLPPFFASWEDLNRWLERWSGEIADLRIDGT